MSKIFGKKFFGSKKKKINIIDYKMNDGSKNK